jgi:hypothetical protein
MKTFATILLASALTVACSDKKSEDSKAPKSPAGTATGSGEPSSKGGKSPDGKPRDTAGDGTTGETEIDWSEPLRGVEVKSFHLLPLDKGKLSGYCIASSEKKVLPKEADEILKAGDGPCPDTVDLDGEAAAIQYVCPAHETDADAKSQTILYAKIRTANGYESVKKIGSAIVNGFCDRSNVN